VFRHPENGVELWIKREDELHPVVSGNKFRKLKYNIIEAKGRNQDTLLTFGGAFSNHIAATAAASKMNGLQSIGIIRGDELGENLKETLSQNQTLKFASESGMRLEFISRKDYRKKNDDEFISHFKQKFGRFYHIPEGGTNALAVKGCEEILTPQDKKFNVVTSSLGTGGTFAGLANSAFPHQKLMGFPALRGDFLKAELTHWTKKENWKLCQDFHFGGYAKVNAELIDFINRFYKTYKIPLDPIYTGKMVYGLFELIEQGYFAQGSKIIAIHTGGLQGVYGVNKKLKEKGMNELHF
jgi:1-aminocyclopropane-1-carboxylate deaminase